LKESEEKETHHKERERESKNRNIVSYLFHFVVGWKEGREFHLWSFLEIFLLESSLAWLGLAG
jgi:hypothetical protein